MIPTPPLRVRNHLAEIILAALVDGGARGELAALGEPGAPAPGWLEHDELVHAAAALFDAHLYFEVHELLEPSWRDARGNDREALQGLIQVAVGYQHLANGNFAGARALLDEGRGRLRGRNLDGLDLDAFGQAVARSLDHFFHFDWRAVPAFPRLVESTSERKPRES